jgi:RNA polymerase sigma factor (sigma-70 family)
MDGCPASADAGGTRAPTRARSPQRGVRPFARRATNPGAVHRHHGGVTLSATRAHRSDDELVASAGNGDKHAFAELVGRHRATAHSLAQRMLHDPDLAGDAVQEAVVVALVSLPRLRSADRFGSWLCGITLNVARRWLRELRALRVTSDLDPADDGPRPDEAAEATVLAERVREAIAALAPGQRDAVLLFYLQGLSHREVAAELAISVGAVKARLHQARTALAPRLAEEIKEAPCHDR